jgi:hypothetical protein
MAVTGFEISARSEYAGGQAFGKFGPYEHIQGRLHFAVDPALEANQVICDLGLAPRTAAGGVEFSADFQLLRPYASRAGGRLLYDVVNRGNKTVGRLNLAQGAQDAALAQGDGFLMRQGFTLAWCGWQPDAPDQPGAMRAYLPEALDNGARITGGAFLQFQPAALVGEQMLSDAGHRPLPTADPLDPTALLTVRDYQDGPTSVVPRSAWRFGRLDSANNPIEDPSFISCSAGFQPGKVYELSYRSVGAVVIGLGLLATRDCISWLRYGDEESGNAVAGGLSHAYGFGVSLSARYLREFVYLGLNEDEHGRQVFDGLLTIVGSSRRGEFNFRFAQPSTNIARAPGNLPPFTYDVDSTSGEAATDSLLRRARAQGKVPKLVALNSGMEYWWSGASLQHIDQSGSHDLQLPEEVRSYFVCGTQHGSGGLPLTDRMVGGFRTAHLLNTVDYHPIARAALLNLDRWVRDGASPPPSNVPSIAGGTAVTRESLEPQIRSIPDAGFPKHLPKRSRLDFGPDVAAGMMQYPPKQGSDYSVVVSSLDSDGNEVGGVRPIDLRVPLATYTGWNLRHADVGEPGEYVSGPLPGSTLPFARTTAERRASGDPRGSIDERYSGREDFLVRVRSEAKEMVAEGHLLTEDIAVVECQAGDRWVAFMHR